MTPEQIIKQVSEETGVSVPKIYEKNRSQYVFRARLRVYKLLRELGLSYPEIGKLLGRNHTTILVTLRNEIQRELKK